MGIKFFSFILTFIFVFSLVGAVTTNNQFTNPSFNDIYSGSQIGTYWPGFSNGFNQNSCSQGDDFLVIIPPAGCTPQVVRSDLLAEQNVPVTCKLESLQVNPLIDVSSIKSISFQGDYPEEVAGVSYHPSRAALRSYNTLLGSPVVNEIGYVTIILKRQPDESSNPTNVSGLLTASISYDSQNAFGVGKSEFYLKTMDESDWQLNYQKSSFWQGRGFLRVIDSGNGRATVAVYSDKDKKINQFTLRQGETSSLFYFPGFYCQAGLRLKLNSIVADEDSALLNVGDDAIWVREGSKILDNRCTVRDVEINPGNTGKVLLYCSGEGRVELSLENTYNAVLQVGPNAASKNYKRGDIVIDNEGTENDWSLAYSGVLEKSISDERFPGEEFIVLVKKEQNNLENKVYSEIAKNIQNVFIQEGNLQTLNQFKTSIVANTGLNENQVEIVFEEGKNIGGTDVSIQNLVSEDDVKENKGTEERKEVNSEVQRYFDETDKALNELLSTYPKTENNKQVAFGEEALYMAIEMIDDLRAKGNDGFKLKQQSYMERFLEIYPQSSRAEFIKSRLRYEKEFDYSDAFDVIYVNNNYYSIGLVELRPQDVESKKVSISVDGDLNSDMRDRKEGDKIYLESEDNPPYIEIDKIEPTFVDVTGYYYEAQKTSPTKVNLPRLRYDVSGEDISNEYTIGKSKYRLIVNDIDVEEVVSVSLIPEVKKASKANFTFNIGIERREFEITPEQANKTASELNETIQKWEERNKALGELVEAWNGVCLITGTLLQAKNLFEGFGGESLARQEVMESWREECDKLEKFQDKEREVCYSDSANKEQIEKDVSIYEAAIKAVNKEMSDNKNSLKTWQSSKERKDQSYPLEGEEPVKISEFTSLEQAQKYILYENIKDTAASDHLKKKTRLELETSLQVAVKMKEQDKEIISLRDQLPDLFKDSASSYETNSKNVKITLKNVKPIPYETLQENFVKGDDSAAYDNFVGLIGSSSQAQKSLGVSTFEYNNKKRLAIVVENGNSLRVTALYDIEITSDNKMKIIGFSNDDIKPEEVAVSPNAIGKKCTVENSWSTKDMEVKFHETGSVKGLAGLAPINKEGWYVYVPAASGSLFSEGVKGYSASGVPQFYYICNVGDDKTVQYFEGDACFSVDINSPANEFGTCSLDASDVSELRRDAENVLRQVSSQYGKKDYVEISNDGIGPVKVASPMTGSDGDLYECTDFMSVDECKLLYNVCDPVICPPSRCDFGGQYPVSDVVQSGIIGSLTLCLPNFIGFEGGDVFVPVCLTGVHAGIDAYVSILKSQQACMEEAARTGSHVGICDEITAIYKCEFFWRQAGPLFDNLIPNLAQFLYTGSIGGQGGGEYATFQTAWDNTQQSLQYLRDTYAQTTFSPFSFNYGSVEEFGSAACRGFVGTSLPTSADGIDNLLEPRSPYQFYAQFDEIPFTDATVPPTSQYKVFYHIYSGNDQGVAYNVYLKDPPQTSYYANAQYLQVDSGFISAGQQASESKDFTAPAGYKQLCVDINGKTECGFQSVTTDFGIDQISEAYDRDQASREDITTEKECIQGSPSALGVANLNPQEGLQEAIDPSINLRGIVRVCATENPGRGTSSYKWKDVGHCGDENIRCWLDESSVNDEVAQIVDKDSFTTIANAQDLVEGINLGNTILTEEESSELISKLRYEVQEVESVESDGKKTVQENVVTEFEKIAQALIDKAFLNSQRAEAMFLKFDFYRVVTLEVAGITVERKSNVLAPDANRIDSILSLNEGNEGEGDNSVVEYIDTEDFRKAQEDKEMVEQILMDQGYVRNTNNGRIFQHPEINEGNPVRILDDSSFLSSVSLEEKFPTSAFDIYLVINEEAGLYEFSIDLSTNEIIFIGKVV